MANGIESFSEKKQLAAVSAGLKGGGPYFSNPVTVPDRSFVEGWPVEVSEKLKAGPIPAPTPMDPWVMRRNNSSMK